MAGALHYIGFMPNPLHKPGLLGNLYSSCAARAQMMAARFTDGTLDADAFSLDPMVLARRLDRLRAAAPVSNGCCGVAPMMPATAGGN
jgi:hypothetical protein